jgi:hypothetical protein
MAVFLLVALTEVLIGIMVLILFNPEYRKKFMPLKLFLNIDYLIFDVDKNILLLKKANKFTFYFCVFFAFLTLLNAILYYRLQMTDYKDALIKITFISFLPFRYICLFILKSINKKQKGSDIDIGQGNDDV